MGTKNQVLQVIQMIQVMQASPVSPVSPVSPLSPVGPVSLAHLWVLFGFILVAIESFKIAHGIHACRFHLSAYMSKCHTRAGH